MLRNADYNFSLNKLPQQKEQSPPSKAAAGNRKTQASAMLRMVPHCSPLPLASIVPAMPLLSTCVVLTGNPI